MLSDAPPLLTWDDPKGNVLLLRWDTKPDKRIRGTFLRPARHAERLSMPQIACALRHPVLPLSGLVPANAQMQKTDVGADQEVPGPVGCVL